MQSSNGKPEEPCAEQKENVRRLIRIEINATPAFVLTWLSAAVFVAVMTVIDIIKLIMMLIR